MSLAHRVHGEPAAPCPGRRAAAASSARRRTARVSRRSAIRTMSTYSRVRASGLSNRTPCQPSETCGPETPRPSRNRPPDSVSRVAAVIAVIAGVRAGIWKTADADVDALGLRGDPGEHGGGVGAVGLGGPARRRSRAGRPPGPARGCPRRCRHPSSRGSARVAWVATLVERARPAPDRRGQPDRSATSVGCRPWSSDRLGRTGLQGVAGSALGTMTWGRDTDEHEAADQLVAFVEAGGTLVDTAAGYGDGESERVLGGAARRRRRPRGGRARDQGRHLPAHRRAGRRHLAPRAARRARRVAAAGSAPTTSTCGRCTRWSDDTAAGGDAVGAGPRGRAPAGRATPASRTTPAGRPARAATWQRAGPAGRRWSSTQVEYSLLQRGIEREVLPAAAALGLGVLPGRRSAAGVLTGKYRAGHAGRLARPPRRTSPAFVEPLPRTSAPRHRRRGRAPPPTGSDASPLEVALAWVRDRPGVTAPIVGARTAAQLRGSLTVRGG